MRTEGRIVGPALARIVWRDLLRARWPLEVFSSVEVRLNGQLLVEERSLSLRRQPRDPSERYSHE